MRHLIIVTFAGVAPIADVDAAVGAVVDCDATEPGIVRKQKILAVMGDVARAFAFEQIVVDAIAVQIAGEQAAAILLGPVVAKVNHAPDMGVAAAGVGVGAFAAARFGPTAARPVLVV